MNLSRHSHTYIYIYIYIHTSRSPVFLLWSRRKKPQATISAHARHLQPSPLAEAAAGGGRLECGAPDFRHRARGELWRAAVTSGSADAVFSHQTFQITKSAVKMC